MKTNMDAREKEKVSGALPFFQKKDKGKKKEKMSFAEAFKKAKK